MEFYTKYINKIIKIIEENYSKKNKSEIIKNIGEVFNEMLESWCSECPYKIDDNACDSCKIDYDESN